MLYEYFLQAETFSPGGREEAEWVHILVIILLKSVRLRKLTIPMSPHPSSQFYRDYTVPWVEETFSGIASRLQVVQGTPVIQLWLVII